MWVKAETPRAWTGSDTVLIPKPAGDPTVIKNKRPIALANTMYKLWTSLITVCTAAYCPAARLFSDNQEAYRAHKNTERMIHGLLNAISDAALTHQDLFVTYVDFSSAFNTIDHDCLLRVMYDMGLP
ncbi:MAG: reverse transcriptase domain-containing protein, partial [bacterium]